MSKQFFDNIKNIPAKMLAFLLVAIAPTTPINYSIFQGELITDEKILWTGQPVTKFILTGGDIALTLFGLVWTGFSLTFVRAGFESGDRFMISISIAFVLFGLYLLIGRFVNNNYEKKRTFYAVTNQRVLIITNSYYTKSVQAKLINQIPILIKNIRKDGIGTIQFDNYQYSTSGENVVSIDVPTFHDIKDVDTVYKLINDLKRPREIA